MTHTSLIDSLNSAILTRAAYPVDEARELLGGISRKSIYDLIESGQLRSVKLAGRRLIPADAIAAVLAPADPSHPENATPVSA